MSACVSFKICNFAIEKIEMKTQINTIVFVGSGNVATRLAIALHLAGKTILQIYSRSEDSAKLLGDKLGIEFTSDYSEINREADLYILSVPDNALEGVVGKLDLSDRFIVHTSGTSSMDSLNKFLNYGVFYPLQTFSTEVSLTFKKIPIFIQANSEENLDLLQGLADTISEKVQKINTEQRRVLHVSAVFASNFTNYMYAVAEDILDKNDLSFELLKPLIEETAEKLKNHAPHEAQTGPARRNDKKIIEDHLEILTKYPEYQKIYKLITEQIKKKHH